jgi:hypothetical protein
VSPSPAPATSNGANGFPVRRFPVRFTPRVMRPIGPGALSGAGPVLDAVVVEHPQRPVERCSHAEACGPGDPAGPRPPHDRPGPNFEAGVTTDVVVETSWEQLGRVLTDGLALPLRGEPRTIGGHGRDRYVYCADRRRLPDHNTGSGIVPKRARRWRRSSRRSLQRHLTACCVASCATEWRCYPAPRSSRSICAVTPRSSAASARGPAGSPTPWSPRSRVESRQSRAARRRARAGRHRSHGAAEGKAPPPWCGVGNGLKSTWARVRNRASSSAPTVANDIVRIKTTASMLSRVTLLVHPDALSQRGSVAVDEDRGPGVRG